MTPDAHTNTNSNTKKKPAKPWFFSQLFKTLLITCVLNLIIWGGVIASLPFFGPEIEHFLFPSVKQIQTIRTELTRIHVIQDEKSKELTSLAEQTQRDLATLKQSLNALSDQIKVLHNQVSAPVAGLAVPGSSEIATHWNALLKNFEIGNSFEEQLHSLDPFIANDKDVLMAVNELVNVASQKTRPFDKLAADLVLIKEKLNNNTQTSPDTDNSSWLDKLWKKAKEHISFERADQVIIPPHDTAKGLALREAIDKALAHIGHYQFDNAIQIIKDIHAQPTFNQWIMDAEKRLSIEQKVEVLRQRLVPLLNKKVV